ncbi:hypothetical protein [Deinococcus rubellus]|uniref:hypothetical protein n=1 Tax=Deinococcus rubellus TaxID=1889240 RepID=UPI0031EB6D1F
MKAGVQVQPLRGVLDRHGGCLTTFSPDPAHNGFQADLVFIHTPDFDLSSCALNTRFNCLDSFREDFFEVVLALLIGFGMSRPEHLLAVGHRIQKLITPPTTRDLISALVRVVGDCQHLGVRLAFAEQGEKLTAAALYGTGTAFVDGPEVIGLVEELRVPDRKI